MILVLDASALLACEDSADPHYGPMRELVVLPVRSLTLDLARYETANVAIHSWRSPEAADRLRRRLASMDADRAVISGSEELLGAAVGIAERYRISVYDASYAAAARAVGAQLVSCDVRDLVSNGLAILPADALALEGAS